MSMECLIVGRVLLCSFDSSALTFSPHSAWLVLCCYRDRFKYLVQSLPHLIISEPYGVNRRVQDNVYLFLFSVILTYSCLVICFCFCFALLACLGISRFALSCDVSRRYRLEPVSCEPPCWFAVPLSAGGLRCGGFRGCDVLSAV